MMRSLMYVPGNRPDFLQRAASCGADAIIIDLEDAVPETRKNDARGALREHVPQIAQGGAKVLVRINSEPERLVDDALAACLAGADSLCVPKVNTVETLLLLARAVERVEAEMERRPLTFLALIEDAEGLFEARNIARAPRVMALACGGEDLALSMNAEPSPEVLRLPHLLVHYAAKAAGVLSFGILRSIVDYADLSVMRDAAVEARGFGFDGASCIHPSVVPILNEAFSPSSEELDWARKVVAAHVIEAAGGRGAFMLEGRFVDSPVVKRAEALLAAWG